MSLDFGTHLCKGMVVCILFRGRGGVRFVDQTQYFELLFVDGMCAVAVLFGTPIGLGIANRKTCLLVPREILLFLFFFPILLGNENQQN